MLLGLKSMSKDKMNFWNKLINDDTSSNVMAFFLLSAIFITLVLMSMPIIALALDIYDHRMITIDLSGLSSYILSVTGIFGSAGISAGWSIYSQKKFGAQNPQPQVNNNSYDYYSTINNNTMTGCGSQTPQNDGQGDIIQEGL